MEKLWSNISAIVIIILAIGLIAVAFVKPTVVEVGPGIVKETIDVSADGLASADPNKAEIFITVETTAETAEDTQAQNADTVNSLRLALVGTKLADEVTTTSFYVYPSYGYYYGSYAGAETGAAIAPSGSGGYTVVHSLKVSTDSVNGVGKLIDVATANGATRIDYVQFSLSDAKAEDLKKDALKSAAEKAKDKAQTLASATGVSLGKPIHISESSYYYPPIYYGAEKLALSADSGAPTQVTPGQIEVSATVSITYEIA